MGMKLVDPNMILSDRELIRCARRWTTYWAPRVEMHLGRMDPAARLSARENFRLVHQRAWKLCQDSGVGGQWGMKKHDFDSPFVDDSERSKRIAEWMRESKFRKKIFQQQQEGKLDGE